MPSVYTTLAGAAHIKTLLIDQFSLIGKFSSVVVGKAIVYFLQFAGENFLFFGIYQPLALQTFNGV
jgi:hypothetical protein